VADMHSFECTQLLNAGLAVLYNAVHFRSQLAAA